MNLKMLAQHDVKPQVPKKMLRSLSGPLYFGPKCRKHVYKVYHHNRDCTIPACKPHLP